MCKSCDNCYWKHYTDMWCLYNPNKPKKNICENHHYICCECESDKSEYKYNEKYYCIDCLLKKFEVEAWTQTHYSIRGEYLGSDEDMDEVIQSLDSGIEELD